MTKETTTLTRANLAESVQQELGLSRSDSNKLVEDVLETVICALEEGQDVKIATFGTFSLRDKKARVGRNPKSGVEVTITPRRVISFKASNLLKNKILQAA